MRPLQHWFSIDIFTKQFDSSKYVFGSLTGDRIGPYKSISHTWKGENGVLKAVISNLVVVSSLDNPRMIDCNRQLSVPYS
jgi:hypothetical protein